MGGLGVTEKGVESIKGVEAHHYSVSIDDQLKSKLLSKVGKSFSSDLSNEDNEKLNQMIASSTINSFDVWVGKGNPNIYQYSVSLDIPLSQIIDSVDPNIGGSKVSILWTTVYYDFNVQNNLFMPTEFTMAEDFLANSNKLQIKNGVYGVKEFADKISVKENGYGVKANTSGSCDKATDGSIFSSTGHSESVKGDVSNISMLLNDVLKRTNGNGFCYSSLKDWSFTVPIADSYSQVPPQGGYSSFFCVDSTGAKENLIAYPKGGTCLPKVAIPGEVKPKN
jgi:hypothetical protein